MASTQQLEIKRLLEEGNRPSALRALYRYSVTCVKVQRSDSYTPAQKYEMLNDISDTFSMIAPFNNTEIIYYNQLKDREMPCDPT